jgi:hypothetical protein
MYRAAHFASRRVKQLLIGVVCHFQNFRPNPAGVTRLVGIVASRVWCISQETCY